MRGRPALRRAAGIAGVTGLACLLASGAGQAQMARLDDSASPRGRVTAYLEAGGDGGSSGPARPPGGGSSSPFAVVRFDGVEYRLATAAYVGRRARIFYVVPANIIGLRSPAGLRVEWRGMGLFASGSAAPGDRVPVWSGTVPGPWMGERFDLRMRYDLREILPMPSASALEFESYFEIEVLP
jgi:hypothetical protein